VECERASLEVIGREIRVVPQAGEEALSVPFDPAPSSDQVMLDLFKAYVEDGVEPPSSGRNNLWTVAMVEAGGVSSDEGRIVDVAELVGR
jgi:hypothetical protein